MTVICNLTNRENSPTSVLSNSQKVSYGLQNIFANPRAFLGLCWVVFKSRYFADAKRKDLVSKTLGFFSEFCLWKWDLITGNWELWNGIGIPLSFSGHFYDFSFSRPGNLLFRNMAFRSHQHCSRNKNTEFSEPTHYVKKTLVITKIPITDWSWYGHL